MTDSPHSAGAEPDQPAVDLAQALMAEITARLEDLAAAAAEQQLAVAPNLDLANRMRAVLVLIDAHSALLDRAGETQGS